MDSSEVEVGFEAIDMDVVGIDTQPKFRALEASFQPDRKKQQREVGPVECVRNLQVEGRGSPLLGMAERSSAAMVTMVAGR